VNERAVRMAALSMRGRTCSRSGASCCPLATGSDQQPENTGVFGFVWRT
jgi:hypothetical protein